jgi:hypothetical protein
MFITKGYWWESNSRPLETGYNVVRTFNQICDIQEVTFLIGGANLYWEIKLFSFLEWEIYLFKYPNELINDKENGYLRLLYGWLLDV